MKIKCHNISGWGLLIKKEPNFGFSVELFYVNEHKREHKPTTIQRE